MNEKTQFLVFRLENRSYGLNLTRVERVIRAVDATPLPQAPGIVLGAIDFQGRIIPLLDIRSRFGFLEREIGVEDQFIIAATSRRTVAIAVDEVKGVVESSRADFLAAGQLHDELAQVEGVIRFGDDLLIIHDLDKFLSGDEERALTHSLAR